MNIFKGCVESDTELPPGIVRMGICPVGRRCSSLLQVSPGEHSLSAGARDVVPAAQVVHGGQLHPPPLMDVV